MMENIIKPISSGAFTINERNDCTVRALANSAGILYGNAHNILRKYGRKDKKGCTHNVWHDAYTNTGMSLIGVYGKTHRAFSLAHTLKLKRNKGITLGRILPQLKDGRYLVIITGHALAVVNSSVIDLGYVRSNSSVVAVYKQS